MKRILIAITVPLVFFSTTVSNVQGNDIDIVFGGLLVNLKNHADEIKLIEKDFLNIAQETSNLTQHEILLNIHDCLHETNENYNDLINLLFTTIYVDKKDLMLFKEYCGHIYLVLGLSCPELEKTLTLLQKYQPYLESKVALHSAEKAKKIMAQAISDIKIAMDIISKVYQ